MTVGDDGTPKPIEFNLGDRKLVIPENILCGASWSALRDAVDADRAKKAKSLIQLAEIARKSRDEATANVLTQGAVQLVSAAIGWNDIANCVSDPRLLPIAIATVTDVDATYAEKFCAEYHSYRQIENAVHMQDQEVKN